MKDQLRRVLGDEATTFELALSVLKDIDPEKLVELGNLLSWSVGGNAERDVVLAAARLIRAINACPSLQTT